MTVSLDGPPTLSSTGSFLVEWTQVPRASHTLLACLPKYLLCRTMGSCPGGQSHDRMHLTELVMDLCTHHHPIAKERRCLQVLTSLRFSYLYYMYVAARRLFHWSDGGIWVGCPAGQGQHRPYCVDSWGRDLQPDSYR